MPPTDRSSQLLTAHRRRRPLHPLRPQVVGWALLSLALWGFRFSWQFEEGQKWDGYLPGLRQGSLLGRRVVSEGERNGASRRPFAAH